MYYDFRVLASAAARRVYYVPPLVPPPVSGGFAALLCHFRPIRAGKPGILAKTGKSDSGRDTGAAARRAALTPV